MSPFVVCLIGIGFLFLLIALRMPLAFAFISVGFLGLLYSHGPSAALLTLAQKPYETVVHFGYVAIPLFILMGFFCFYAGISRDLYSFFYKWIGGIPGGLAMATVTSCGAFAAVSGSSVATAAAMGSVTLPEMKRYNYSPRLATGCVAAGGTIGALIPPSILFIIYGVLTGTSIGKLFMAGFFPGLLEVLLYCSVIYALVKRYPDLAPPAPSTPWRERFVAVRTVWPVAILAFLVLGGIYSGIFTATESAAMGAFAAFLFLLGKRQLTRQNFVSALLDTANTACMVFFLIVGAMIFNLFLTLSGFPLQVSKWLVSLPLSSYSILALMLFIYLPLGCFMDCVGMVLVTLPVFLPVMKALGFDPIWIGVLIVRVMEIALITPPLGLNVFVIRGIAKEVPLGEIFLGIMPFFFADILSLVILVAFPQISLFLPRLMN